MQCLQGLPGADGFTRSREAACGLGWAHPTGIPVISYLFVFTKGRSKGRAEPLADSTVTFHFENNPSSAPRSPMGMCAPDCQQKGAEKGSFVQVQPAPGNGSPRGGESVLCRDEGSRACRGSSRRWQRGAFLWSVCDPWRGFTCGFAYGLEPASAQWDYGSDKGM